MNVCEKERKRERERHTETEGDGRDARRERWVCTSLRALTCGARNTYNHPRRDTYKSTYDATTTNTLKFFANFHVPCCEFNMHACSPSAYFVFLKHRKSRCENRSFMSKNC